ncbi:MAG TPA: two-component sensor histidine kinase, partial [Acetobacteraceae bacterium]|nr:two-component sensor histidine kinase [Acetobacteraceae bacterium]
MNDAPAQFDHPVGPARPGLQRRRVLILNSAGVRFAAIYAGLLAISAGALAMFLWWATAGLLDRQVEAAIRTDAQGLAQRWEEGGVAALVLAIEDRLAGNVDDDAIYLLVDPQMQPVAGNLSHWPEVVQRTDGWYELEVQRAGVRSLAQVRRYDLLNGYHLLVGRDVRNRAQLRDLLTDALLWAMLVVAVMATAGG